MNRRRFIEIIGKGVAGAAVAYSFPSIIVPKNIIVPVRLVDVFPDGMDLIVPPYSYDPVAGIKGISYFIENTGYYYGLARDECITLRSVP